MLHTQAAVCRTCLRLVQSREVGSSAALNDGKRVLDPVSGSDPETGGPGSAGDELPGLKPCAERFWQSMDNHACAFSCLPCGRAGVSVRSQVRLNVGGEGRARLPVQFTHRSLRPSCLFHGEEVVEELQVIVGPFADTGFKKPTPVVIGSETESCCQVAAALRRCSLSPTSPKVSHSRSREFPGRTAQEFDFGEPSRE
jgi:hypothetical protein